MLVCNPTRAALSSTKTRVNFTFASENFNPTSHCCLGARSATSQTHVTGTQIGSILESRHGFALSVWGSPWVFFSSEQQPNSASCCYHQRTFWGTVSKNWYFGGLCRSSIHAVVLVSQRFVGDYGFVLFVWFCPGSRVERVRNVGNPRLGVYGSSSGMSPAQFLCVVTRSRPIKLTNGSGKTV